MTSPRLELLKISLELRPTIQKTMRTPPPFRSTPPSACRKGGAGGMDAGPSRPPAFTAAAKAIPFGAAQDLARKFENGQLDHPKVIKLLDKVLGKAPANRIQIGQAIEDILNARKK
jgi:hypothetical protein